MVLEATVLVIDNSEWMRNGDYTPTRTQAQSDAVNLLFNAKTQSNPENTVALMTMAGKQPEVLVTLTNEFGKVLSAMHRVHNAGTPQFSTGIQIAQLVLKHRQNKNQRQRVIVFVGSPLVEEEKELVKLAKKLKKNNIAVDVVNFGEHEVNTGKLEAFVTAVNSADNSHLLTVVPGPNLLSDALISSAIVHGEDGPPAGFAGGAGGAGFDFGVDPTLDPELAMALRMSLEEERARQEAEAQRQSASGGAGATAAAAPTSTHDDDAMAVDTDPLLAQAMAMSQQPAGAAPAGMSEDEELQRALLMSMQDAGASSGGEDADMQYILGTLPGVDPNDPRIQEAMGKKKEDKK
ncbi:hypothetical protein BCR44DRAFT_1391299 [Catenaria anguillulae PL171]|uniref:VWFA domain-containing protein n=1 Tax=Catenaria anguillulae PL171 TaxID=765915 RepID=A0A1Y2HH79_9FUNG|nr:hypothetical protein BCR44DRAFT_1391299 [Catenaria anguillulae PL171]